MKDLEKFCIEYSRSGNATQSASIAGYKCPAQAGLRLSRRKDVIERVEAIKAQAIVQYAQDALIISKSLSKKENWQSKLVTRLTDDMNLPDFVKVMELFAKSAGHLQPDNNPQSINILNISSDGFMAKAQAILAKLSSASHPTSDNVINAEHSVLPKDNGINEIQSEEKR